MKACLLGEKLSYSFSKELHESLGTNYNLQEISPQNLQAFVQNNTCDGYNVTIPYKQAIMPLLDELDSSALITGCVNTVLRKGKKNVGYNTDIDGVRYVFDTHGIVLQGKNAVVLGSGATSHTVCAFLKSRGANVTVISRQGENNYQNYGKLTNTQVLVNTTPVGTFPACVDSLVDIKAFPNLQFVFDVVYNPLKTKLILQAESLGIKSCGGLPMLVAQALRAEELWQNKPMPSVQQLLAPLTKQASNVVLVGMPSCGKTTVGKLVAQKLNKTFVDLDCEIQRCEKSPAQIIEECGEERFRAVEQKVAANFAQQHGLVIATGGGTVLNNQNVEALRQNGFVVWLQRDLQLLSTQNRPISKAVGVQQLFEQRKHLYASASHFVCQNDDVQTAANNVASVYENWLKGVFWA